MKHLAPFQHAYGLARGCGCLNSFCSATDLSRKTRLGFSTAVGRSSRSHWATGVATPDAASI